MFLADSTVASRVFACSATRRASNAELGRCDDHHFRTVLVDRKDHKQARMGSEEVPRKRARVEVPSQHEVDAEDDEKMTVILKRSARRGLPPVPDSKPTGRNGFNVRRCVALIRPVHWLHRLVGLPSSVTRAHGLCQNGRRNPR